MATKFKVGENAYEPNGDFYGKITNITHQDYEFYDHHLTMEWTVDIETAEGDLITEEVYNSPLYKAMNEIDND